MKNTGHQRKQWQLIVFSHVNNGFQNKILAESQQAQQQ